MTLDMMFANFQDGNAKANKQTGDEQDSVNKTGDSKKQDFANKMQTVQEGTVNAAWASFKEKVEALPAGTPVAEATEQIFKKSCDAAIAAMLLAAALMV